MNIVDRTGFDPVPPSPDFSLVWRFYAIKLAARSVRIRSVRILLGLEEKVKNFFFGL